MSRLVIGVGNPSRGDDAVGPVVAESMGLQLGDAIRTFSVHGDLSDLVMRWGPEDDVLVIDAMLTGREPGTVVEIDLLEREPQGVALPVSSHGVGLMETVDLARLLHRLPRSLRVVAVEGQRFGHFEPLSDSVAAAVPSLVGRLSSRLRSQGAGNSEAPSPA